MRSLPCLFLSALLGASFALQVDVSDAQEVRTWSDATGKFRIEARFSEVQGQWVILEKPTGEKMRIPLEKLSAADQAFAKQAMSAGSSPFETIEESPFAPVPAGASSVSPTSTTGPRIIDVDYTRAGYEIPIQSGADWNLNLADAPAPSYQVRTTAIPKTSDFWDKLNHVTVNDRAKRAVVTYNFSKPGRDSEKSTRMVLVDLETGRKIGISEGEGMWTARAIHDDGERIVVANLSESDESAGQLGTVRISGNQMTPLDLWNPYARREGPAKERVVRFAAFGNGGRLITVSQAGDGVIWEFESRRPLARFKYHGACQPTISSDRKMLGICGGDLVGMIPLDSRADPVVKEAPGMNYWLTTAFSPSGKRFAAATMAKLMIWDVENGEVLFEGPVTDVNLREPLIFPHEDFILLGKQLLFEYDSGIKVWQYSGINAATSLMGQPLVASLDRSGGSLFTAKIPHSEALATLDKARNDPGLFVLREGVDVAIDVNKVPGQYRQEVQSSLENQVAKMKCQVNPGAPLRLVAEISGPKSKEVRYMFAGTFTIQEYTSSLRFDYEGQTLWRRGTTNTPGMIGSTREKSMQQQIDEAGRKPNLGYFGAVSMPQYLQKPTQKSASPGAAAGAALGASAVSR